MNNAVIGVVALCATAIAVGGSAAATTNQPIAVVEPLTGDNGQTVGHSDGVRDVTWRWKADSDETVTFSTGGSEAPTSLRVERAGKKVAVARASDVDGATAVSFKPRPGAEYTIVAQTAERANVVLAWADDEPDDIDVPRRGTEGIALSGTTGEKPQSKLWRTAQTSWAVLPTVSLDDPGTWVWRFDDVAQTWAPVFRLSEAIDTQADVIVDGHVTHILTHGQQPELHSIEFDETTGRWQRWRERAAAVELPIAGSETATLAIDGDGRLWVAYDEDGQVAVTHAQPPYSTFASPTVLAEGTDPDDISAIVSLPDGTVGVLWSDQRRDQFAFRHTVSDQPLRWSATEIAADAHSGFGPGIADDHLNMKVTQDGRIVAAVKTSQDWSSQSTVLLLQRTSDGVWRQPLGVAGGIATRPIVAIDEQSDSLAVLFTQTWFFDNIDMKMTRLSDPDFSASPITVARGAFNNVTTSRVSHGDELLALAGSADSTVTIRVPWPQHENRPTPVHHWSFDTIDGQQSVDDVSASVLAHRDVIETSEGVSGPSAYLRAGHHLLADSAPRVDDEMSISLWFRAEKTRTQRLVASGLLDRVDGIELSIAFDGVPFARVSQPTHGNAHRIDAPSARIGSTPRWTHGVLTVGADRVGLWIDGELVGSTERPPGLNLQQPLAFGAESDGTWSFRGGLDDVMIFDRALDADEVASLARRH